MPLMRMAAGAVAEIAARLLDDEGIDLSEARVVVLAGAGDNGGDGLYAAARLAEAGASVTAVAVGRSPARVRVRRDGARRRQGAGAGSPRPDSRLRERLLRGRGGGTVRDGAVDHLRAHVLIDAMTGIGVEGGLRGIPAAIASSMGLDGAVPERPAAPEYERTRRFPMVVAVDAPSGVGVDDGTLPGAYIPADATVTFGAMKPCAMMPPACYAQGRLTLVDFGFDVDDAEPAVEMVDDETAGELVPAAATDRLEVLARRGRAGDRFRALPRRPRCSLSRGPHVRMWVWCGIWARSGRRTWCWPPAPKRCWARGMCSPGSSAPRARCRRRPGRRRHPARDDRRLLRHYDAGEPDAPNGVEPEGDAYDMPPIVVDAGALDLLPNRVPPQVLITPHAAELARLLQRLGEDVDVDDVLAEPWRCARRAHALTGATVLLKGAVTILVGEEDGEERTILSGAAPAWLSHRRAGDVLAGMLGALLAQNAPDTPIPTPRRLRSPRSAHTLHGLAAGLAADSEQRGWSAPAVYGQHHAEPAPTPGHPIIASDIVAAIPRVFEEVIQ